jgi:phosphatidate cytidylyltransferase
MALVGALAIWAAGLWFLALLAAVAGLMIWELARMLAPKLGALKLVLLALIAASAVLRVGLSGGEVSLLALASLLLAPVIGLVVLPRDRGLFLVYATAISFAVMNLFWLREGAGLNWTIWLILVVVAADIGGYCFGRVIGGAKILPKISPKKTWSGTLGGLLLAAFVGYGFTRLLGNVAEMVVLSIVVAAASQAGDIVESAIKRHTKIKDSSNLIPGHGGFLDRFDALIGASLVMILAAYFIGLPMGGTV